MRFRLTLNLLNLEVEDEDFQEITVQTGSSWYPPLPIPEGVDEDNFQGDDNHPLHRGSWIIFLGYNQENAGTHYGQKYCETLSVIELTLKLMVQAKPTATTCSFQL